jgi:hypothetical protein
MAAHRALRVGNRIAGSGAMRHGQVARCLLPPTVSSFTNRRQGKTFECSLTPITQMKAAADAQPA